ncbi:BspA family leucine-rich repeat surface protein [Vibrio fortis]|uniref:BspA family leucine-rich repeat surface protein n=1 Tax=Vibrio fortis TaxID=212667 RepID=UPI0021C35A5E|nr:BspA family leucine-rich repeat surface protein [Vibrio fortis]
MNNFKIAVLALSGLTSVYASAADFVALISSENIEFTKGNPNPPVNPACVGPDLTRSDLDAMIDNGDDVTKVCTGKITDMSYLFTEHENFNQDISGWDTSNVISMEGMFMQPMALPSTFNHDLSGWDTSSVQNFSYMFLTHVDYQHDLSGWDTSSANNWQDFISLSLSKMDMSDVPAAFHNDKIQAPIDRSNLDALIADPQTKDREIQFANVSQITDFSRLFSNNSTFNVDIGGWDVSNGTTFEGMFSSADSFNQDISGWDVSSGTNFMIMFSWNQGFDQDISGWDTSKVTDPYYYNNFRLGAILQHKHIPLSFQ